MSYEVNDDIYPATAVALIESRWGSYTAFGTGFLVGKNDVLTAAHVIFDSSLGGLADEVKVYPSFDPDDSNNGYFQAVWAEYYENFDPDADGFLLIGDFYRSTFAGTEIDIALIALDIDIGSTYGFFGIDSSFAGGNVSVIGYPGIYGLQPTFDSGTVVKSSVDNVYLINLDLEVNPGNSGGPIYYDYGTGPYAVGIVSTKAAATSLAAHSSWLTDSILENDRFLINNLPVPSYTLDALQSEINEGQSARFALSTTNVPPMTTLNYQLIGVQEEDLQEGGLSGRVEVGEGGGAIISIPTRRDWLTEGDELLTIVVETARASIMIKDTSQGVEGLQRTKVFLSNNSFTAVDPYLQIFGSDGTSDRVVFQLTAIESYLDQTIDQVILSGATDDFRFRQAGNTIEVYSDTERLLSKPIQADSDGSVFTFTNGTFSAYLAFDGVMTLGGVAVSPGVATTIGLNADFIVG